MDIYELCAHLLDNAATTAALCETLCTETGALLPQALSIAEDVTDHAIAEELRVILHSMFAALYQNDKR